MAYTAKRRNCLRSNPPLHGRNPNSERDSGSQFRHSQQTAPTGVENVIADGNNEEVVIYNLQGIRVKNPSTGIYIVNGKKTYIRK